MEENRSKLRELTALHEISRSMQTLDLDEILRVILEGVTRAIGFDRARLYLLKAGEARLECKMAVGIEKEKIEGVSLPLDKETSMVARAVIERKPFIIKDALNDPRVNPELKELLGLRSFAVVPLAGRDTMLGAVAADNLMSDRIITSEDLESLMTFASQAGLALENAKMYEELKSFNRELEERVRTATENLRRAQEKLIQSEKLAALGKLSAGIAHEIRNPLTSMRVLIHSIAEQLKDHSEATEDIKVMEDEIERVNQIIKRFLDFARPTRPEFSSVDMNEVLRLTINLMSREMADRGIAVQTRLVPLPRVRADKEQMKQVFLNVLLNAAEAMPAGGMLTARTARAGDHVRLSIGDTGNGIPGHIKDKLFEPFFTTKEEGIGLGLSIVKRIVDDHRGSIELRDNLPRGTEFTIVLRLDSPEGKKSG